MFYTSGWRGGGVGKDLTRHSRFKRGRGSGGQNQPSLARNERGRVGVAGNTLRLAFRARGGGSGGQNKLSLTQERGWMWQKTPSDSRFEWGRGSGGQNQPSLARNERGRVGVAAGACETPWRGKIPSSSCWNLPKWCDEENFFPRRICCVSR